MPKPGERLGDFTLRRELGRGAMGVVWEAWQESLSRSVALKVLNDAVAEDPLWVARFKAEASAAARLSHPGILPVYAVGETPAGEGVLHWFAMEQVEGEDLAERLKARGPLPFDEAARVVRDAALALDHAHQHGVLHRDVKPANLMLRSDGRVALTDFGLSKETTAGGLTTTGMLVGTPYYMSPELVTGDPARVTPSADVYGLGVTLYELLSGKPPFTSDSAVGLLKLIAEREPPSLRTAQPRLPRDLETIALVCLAKTPDRRYASAAHLAADLDRFLSHEPIARRRPGLGERARRFARKHRLALGVGGAALLALLGVTVFFRGELHSRDQGYRDEIARLLAEADALSEAGDDASAEAIESDLARRAASDPTFAAVHSVVAASNLLNDLRAGKPLSRQHQRAVAAWAEQPPARITLVADASEVSVAGLRLAPGDERERQPEQLTLDGGALVAGLWRLKVSAPGRVRTVVTLVATPGLVARLTLALPSAGATNADMLSYGGVWFPTTHAGEGPRLEALQRPYLLASARVTGQEYAAFLDTQAEATRTTLTPAAWQHARPASGTLAEPLLGLTLAQAEAYAAWKGLRLPRDAELANAAGIVRALAAQRLVLPETGPARTEDERRRLVQSLRQASLALERAEGLRGWDGRPEWATRDAADAGERARPWPSWATKRPSAEAAKAWEGNVALRLARSLDGP